MTNSTQIDVAVIGAGPAGLMAAEVLSGHGLRVTVFDAMPSAARKFLMAGRGGLNLTHSELQPQFLSRYAEAEKFLAPYVDAFTPQMLRDWSAALGEPTFIGSSGRVFPESFKASPLLRAWLRRLQDGGVTLAMRHHWTGWDADSACRFETPDGELRVEARAVVLALGGASWPRLGSDGRWVDLLSERGVQIATLRAANCGFTVPWSDHFSSRFEGTPLKGASFTFQGNSVQSEAMITRAGIEGGAIYALSSRLREAVLAQGEALLSIALRPDLDRVTLAQRLSAKRGKQSLSTFLRKAVHLSPVAIALVQEAAIASNIQFSTLSPDALAALINAVPVRLNGVAPIARAISSAGGIKRDQVNHRLMLNAMPGTFVAGEMLDWEAPTGGYLLQASFATGAAAGRGVLDYLQA